MLFKFLTYLQPIHYFGLTKKDSTFVFPKENSDILQHFECDNRFSSPMAKVYDQSWRALKNGYINYQSSIKNIEPLSVYDNYVFARKYFSNFWVSYVLLLRIFSLKNPFKELNSYLKTRHVKRYVYGNEILNYSNFDTFQSPLIENKVLVSVIIPTLNRYDYLIDVLRDLELQDYENFEVIIIDQSDAFDEKFYQGFNLNLMVKYQKEKALWLARNSAIKQSKGDYILLFDDDSRVEKDWIRNHLKVLDYFNSDLSSGVSISKIGDKIPAHYSYFRISDQLDTGNVLLKKSIFKHIGLFDRQFEKQRMGDGEFGLRAYIYGYRNISNPYARRIHLKVSSGGLREFGAWDAFRTAKWFAPRPIPSVLYYFRTYYGNKLAKLSLLKTIPGSIFSYRFKKNKFLKVLSGLLSIVLLPLIVFQVLKSWHISSKMLKEGPKIEGL